ncbi:MAG: macro domain-containing protein [candidate division FCPU426 bacterium]
MELKIGSTRIVVAFGDLAAQEVDVIIHPTNNYLWFSSYLSDSLKRRGGSNLEREAMELGPVSVGRAVLTTAGRLKCKYLIHAAAWGQDMMVNERQVHQALAEALKVAREHRCASVAMMPSGLCVGGFSLARAFETTFLTVVEHCLRATTIEKLLLVASTESEEEILNSMLRSARSADPPKNEDNV